MGTLAYRESQPGKQSEMCVLSQPTNLARIAEFVGSQARRAGLDEDAVYDIQMAVDEACTNSMNHAYEGQGDGLVSVCCYEDETDFVVSVTDHGRAFDPGTVPEPRLNAPLEEREIGGLGLYLMRKLVDRIEFSSDKMLGNRVVMRKHRKVRPSGCQSPE